MLINQFAGSYICTDMRESKVTPQHDIQLRTVCSKGS